jgi:uncharacterized membrane protein
VVKDLFSSFVVVAVAIVGLPSSVSDYGNGYDQEKRQRISPVFEGQRLHRAIVVMHQRKRTVVALVLEFDEDYRYPV